MNQKNRKILNVSLLVFWVMNAILLGIIDFGIGAECNPINRFERILWCNIIFGDPIFPLIITIPTMLLAWKNNRIGNYLRVSQWIGVSLAIFLIMIITPMIWGQFFRQESAY